MIHVDGTARPQIIVRGTIRSIPASCEAFAREPASPLLINTSFNVHEEPIVDTPDEAMHALLDRRVDFLVTQQAVYVKG